MDTKWFHERISETPEGSQRQLAKKIFNKKGEPIQQSRLSRVLKGELRMQLHEARQFADLFGVPLLEVLRHAGVHVGREKSTEVSRTQLKKEIAGLVSKNRTADLAGAITDHLIQNYLIRKR